MPFPLAHGLLGATTIIALDNQPPFKNCRVILIGAALAVIPDFDYFVNWLQFFGKGWHHGFSHSIIFAIVLGFAGTLLTGKLSWGRFLVLSAAASSHGLLDFLITKSNGIALFAPLSDYRFKLMLPNPIDYAWRNATELETLIDVLRISVIELALLAPIFLIVLFIKRKFFGFA